MSDLDERPCRNCGLTQDEHEGNQSVYCPRGTVFYSPEVAPKPAAIAEREAEAELLRVVESINFMIEVHPSNAAERVIAAKLALKNARQAAAREAAAAVSEGACETPECTTPTDAVKVDDFGEAFCESCRAERMADALDRQQEARLS